MSSQLLERTLLIQQRASRWAEAEEVEDISLIDITYPINVDGDKLEIDSAQLETERVYRFDYLGAKMVLWKSLDGTIDLFQIIE